MKKTTFICWAAWAALCLAQAAQAQNNSSSQNSPAMPYPEWLGPAEADPDGDGQTNGQEYLAGTGSADGHAFLKLTATMDGGGPVRLSFQAGLARRFLVESSDDLKTWTAVGLPVMGEGRLVAVLDDRPRAGVASRSYRVRALGFGLAGNLAYLPAGSFTMGSPASELGRGENEGPTTEVTIRREFWLGTREVTQGEYEALMGYNPSWFSGSTNLPVENVVWTEATNYCARLTQRERAAGNLPRGYEFRLPTEAEWEYACRAGTTTATAFGDTLASAQANFDGNQPYGNAAKGIWRERSTPGGSYAANPWGLYDLHGNVCEWCLDWYTNRLTGGAVTDPQGPQAGTERVLRGGGWHSAGAECRSASRAGANGYDTGYEHGFRVALAPMPGYGQAAITGRLTLQPSGTPVAGILLHLFDLDLPTGQGQATLVATAVTDEAGRYEFANLLPGSYGVEPVAAEGTVELQFFSGTQASRARADLTTGSQTEDFAAADLDLFENSPGNADPGLVTRFFMTGLDVGQSVTPGFAQAPFFFGGKLYAVSRPSSASQDRNRAIFSAGKINVNGKFLYEKSFSQPVGDPQTAIFGAGERFTTCVFNGAVHLFYDVNTGDDKLFRIYHCASGAPEQNWQNIGLLKVSSWDVLGAYTQLGAWRHTPLKAVAFNGRIYLVLGATKGRFLLLSSADGQAWDWVATLDDANSWGDEFLPEMSACVVQRNGQQMLCVAILGARNYQNWAYFRFYNTSNKLAGGFHQYMDWVSPNHGVGIAAGGVRDSLQGQAVQVFGQSSGWTEMSYAPRRGSMDVETGAFQGWVDTSSGTANRGNFIVPCDAVEATVPAGPGGRDVRKYIVLVNMAALSVFGQYVDVVAYESDYFQADPVEKRVNTADANTSEPGCWSLVGVIEGVPPFTRNGTGGDDSLSEISYTRTLDSSLSYDVSFECEIFAKGNAGGKVPEVGEFGLGMTFKNLLSVATGYKVSLKTEGGNTWKAIDVNQDGSRGYLLYAKPTLTSRNYTMRSQDKSRINGSFTLVNVSAVTIDPVEYELANPPRGMLRREPTTNLDYWKNGRGELLVYDNLFINMMEQSRSAGLAYEAAFKMEQTRENELSTSMKTTLEISGQAKFQLGLDVEGEAGLKTVLKLKTTSAKSFSEEIKAQIDAIPAPAAGTTNSVRKLMVSGAWYMPQDRVTLQDILKSGIRPGWIPEANLGQTTAPWLITWKILDIGH